MRIELKTKRYFVCAKCGEHKIVEHLFGDVDVKWGPWHCDGDCDQVHRGTARADGTMDVESTSEPRRRGFALLRRGDMFLVVDQKYGRIENPDFFYHSHQCPEAILRTVQAVYDATGSDPHGLFRYVTSVEDTPETRLALTGGGRSNMGQVGTLQELLAVFKTDGLPAPTEWPEENGGMIPFVAESQRNYANKGNA